jgi:hypothetical protein
MKKDGHNMNKYQYSDTEKELNKVFVKQNNDLSSLNIRHSNMVRKTEDNIAETEQLLQSAGISLPAETPSSQFVRQPKAKLNLRSWEDISNEASTLITYDAQITDIFTPEELKANEAYINCLYNEFKTLHQLDAMDYAIAGVAGVLSAIVDIFLVGIPTKTVDGIKAGPLSNYINGLFDKALPPEKIRELEKLAKVPYDATDNRNTSIPVEGLSAYFHRLHSLGHDPILGFIVGVLDVLRGTMTTIDKNGKIVVQVMEVYADRKESNLFSAIAKVFAHMKSDVNTAMGLPVPLMGLFELFQFGEIGEEKLSVAEIVRGMYGEGYDFKHFCSMSVPVMIIEVIVRISYCIKRMKEGHSFKESIPVGNHEKKPKLATMLWIAHSASTAINAGKVVITRNPLAINYPQWLAFAGYSIKQLKWVLVKKPKLRNKYVQGFINEEWENLNLILEETWQEETYF